MIGYNRLTQLIGALVVANSLYFAGCAESDIQPPQTKHVIDSEEIYAVVNVYPMNGAVITDPVYTTIDQTWLNTTFKNQLNWKLSNKYYKVHVFDCENQSVAALDLSGNLGYSGDYSLAIGEFHYIRDFDSRAHSLNFFIYEDRGIFKLGFFEPQTQQIVSLSEKEINSCLHWRI